jgi:hypothetical protein
MGIAGAKSMSMGLVAGVWRLWPRLPRVAGSGKSRVWTLFRVKLAIQQTLSFTVQYNLSPLLVIRQ